MPIVKMEEHCLAQCADILFASALGRNYYPRQELLEEELRKGWMTDEVFMNTRGGNFKA